MSEYFHREVNVKEKILTISQQYVGDVGGVVWDAALVLNSYIETLNCQDKKFVELGAGTGVSGLVAAACGGDAIITDLIDFVPLMKKNLEQNKNCFPNSKVEIQELDWKDIFEDPDNAPSNVKNPHFILISDCIYYESANKWLASTIRSLAGVNTETLLSLELRADKIDLVKDFFIDLKMSFEIKLVNEIPSEYKCDDIQVYSIKRIGQNLKGSPDPKFNSSLGTISE